VVAAALMEWTAICCGMAPECHVCDEARAAEEAQISAKRSECSLHFPGVLLASKRYGDTPVENGHLARSLSATLLN
jgi:hypothetical protein